MLLKLVDQAAQKAGQDKKSVQCAQTVPETPGTGTGTGTCTGETP